MKKHNISLLLVITCIFAAFIAGFFLGRNLGAGDVIVSVPAGSVPAAPAVSQTHPDDADTHVNINSAGIYELASLPGIGEGLAQRIIDYRNAHGSFSTPEELLNVAGIGTTKLEAILDHITTGG